MGSRSGFGVDGRTATVGMGLAEPHVAALDNLDEIGVWLGTFRERLHRAHDEERARVTVLVGRLEERYRQRRAELS